MFLRQSSGILRKSLIVIYGDARAFEWVNMMTSISMCLLQALHAADEISRSDDDVVYGPL